MTFGSKGQLKAMNETSNYEAVFGSYVVKCDDENKGIYRWQIDQLLAFGNFRENSFQDEIISDPVITIC